PNQGHVRDRLRLGRAATWARRGTHEEAAAEAHQIVGRAPGQGDILYRAACVYAQAAAAAATDARLTPLDQSGVQEHYAARAVQLLEQAGQLGYFRSPGKRDEVENSPDLAPLRGRSDFQQLGYLWTAPPSPGGRDQSP